MHVVNRVTGIYRVTADRHERVAGEVYGLILQTAQLKAVHRVEPRVPACDECAPNVVYVVALDELEFQVGDGVPEQLVRQARRSVIFAQTFACKRKEQEIHHVAVQPCPLRKRVHVRHNGLPFRAVCAVNAVIALMANTPFIVMVFKEQRLGRDQLVNRAGCRHERLAVLAQRSAARFRQIKVFNKAI